MSNGPEGNATAGQRCSAISDVSHEASALAQQPWACLASHRCNVRWWVDNATFPADEIATRFHHDLFWIHPFASGNGRHSRMMADALVRSLCQPAFTWGSGGNLVAANEVRARYLTALRTADQGGYQPLLVFVRS